MDFPYDEYDLPIMVEELVSDSVGEILRHERADRFFPWLRVRIRQYLQNRFGQLPDPKLCSRLVVLMGYSLWNAMPLPKNGYKPVPLPIPLGKDPCPCGSGKRYELCCSRVHGIPDLAPEALWPFILKKLPRAETKKILNLGIVPADVLVVTAMESAESGNFRKGVEILFSLFEGKIRDTSDAAGEALKLLLSLYDDLGYTRKKAGLLEFILQKAPSSPLRSAAYQRIAAIEMDRENPRGAWQAFQIAQRDNPYDSGLGMLEIQLLMAEGDVEKARERARFWAKKLQRNGGEDGFLIDFMSFVAEDPNAAFGDLAITVSCGVGAGLRNWLNKVFDRPLPSYAFKKAPSFIDSLSRTMIFIPPLGLERLNREWRRIFPLCRSFSIYDQPRREDVDPWDFEVEEVWTRFLEMNPQGYDSIEILDDLITVVEQHPESEVRWFRERILAPLLLRVKAIVDKVVSGAPGALFQWVDKQNRPALRSLERLVAHYVESDRSGEALVTAESLLRINPEDNHGLRALVMNSYLRTGENDKALLLAEKYQPDLLPETSVGKILAYYRLGKVEDARNAVTGTSRAHRQVLRYLISARVRKPRMRELEDMTSENSQAWLYRDAMREVWMNTSGVLGWLGEEMDHLGFSR